MRVYSVDHPLSFIGVTPAGTYCIDCSHSFLPDHWRMHINKYHSTLNIPKMRDVSIQLKAFISNAQSQDIMIYAKQPTVQKNHLKCNTCQMLYRDAYSFKRHCTVQSSMCKESLSLSVMCYELVCGRFYPVPTEEIQIQHSNSTANAASPTALFPVTPTTTTQTTPN